MRNLSALQKHPSRHEVRYIYATILCMGPVLPMGRLYLEEANPREEVAGEVLGLLRIGRRVKGQRLRHGVL